MQLQRTPQAQRAVRAACGQLHQAARVAALAVAAVDAHGVRGGCSAGTVGARGRLASRVRVPCKACAPAAGAPFRNALAAHGRLVHRPPA